MVYIPVMDIQKTDKNKRVLKESKQTQPHKAKGRFIIIILLFIVLLGAVLRIYKLGENSFLADEFLDINSAYGYYKTGEWRAWDFNLGQPSEIDVYAPRDERAWPYKWQVAQLFYIFPPTEAVARSVSVAWGITTILIMYFVAVCFTKKRAIGLISAFLFTINITAIVYDRKFRMYAMFYPVYLLLSLFLYQFFESEYKGKIRLVKFFYKKLEVNLLYLLPALLAAWVGESIHPITANAAVALIVFCLIMMLMNFWRRRFMTKYTLATFLASAGFAIMYFFMPAKLKWFSGTIKFFMGNEEYLNMIIRDYNFYYLSAAILLLGTFFLFMNKRTKPALWLSVSFFVPLLMAVYLWKHPAGMQYVFALQSFMLIFLACGIYYGAEFLAHKFPALSNRIFLTLIIIMLIILPKYSYFWKEDNTYHRKADAVADYREVFRYVKENSTPDEAILTRNFRNYYLGGARLKVFEFGGERNRHKVSVEDIQAIQKEHPRGWVVFFDNDVDYVSKSANKYIKQNFARIDDIEPDDNSKIYRW